MAPQRHPVLGGQGGEPVAQRPGQVAVQATEREQDPAGAVVPRSGVVMPAVVTGMVTDGMTGRVSDLSGRGGPDARRSEGHEGAEGQAGGARHLDAPAVGQGIGAVLASAMLRPARRRTQGNR